MLLLVVFKRLFGKHGSDLPPQKNEKASPEMMVELIRSGEASRDAFILAYKPYIAKVTSRFCKRYIDPSRDDEFSIALSAFHEAMEQFSSQAGKSFLGFAETVIRRRLIDYVRKEQRHQHTVPYSSFDRLDDEGQTINPIEMQESVSRFQDTQHADARRMEISDYNHSLQMYDIAFMDLPDLSPKHADSREMLIAISRTLASSPGMYESLMETRKLPVKELCQMSGVSRKTIERNRKYLIALAVLQRGDYPYLQHYLEPVLSPQKEAGHQSMGVRV
ncbi:RNA polymerase sigma factor SigI [Paenibacillus nasutitermitis]|uniref:RNA polymerase sigma factor SigI n=1 Tax=Paenibacillus nasutitermitis TaxID=1652958 RepID=UPI001E3B4142|nr:RNA polymerase sigma factor SigI [Paenibacillus nasutitermitis]